MGMRKRINAIIATERKAAKIRRDGKKMKRAGKSATAGQTLHATMHGHTKTA